MKLTKLFLTFFSLGLWLSLLYKILNTIHATDTAWLLFYMYLPVTFMSGILIVIIDKENK